MADATTPAEYHDLLDAINPRPPVFFMAVENDEYSDVEPYARTVRCVVTDSLTCKEILTMEIDPITALNLIERTSFLVIDGERDVPKDKFLEILYSLCAAWWRKRIEPPRQEPVVSSDTIKYNDLCQLIKEAITRNGGACGVELDGYRWEVR